MKVILQANVYDRMREYVEQCEDEISGLCKVERDEERNFIATDIALLQQTVTGATTDIDTDALAKFQVELVKRGENVGEWYLWWHSHVNMQVFWSARDIQTIDDSTDFKRLVSVVTNKRDEYQARLDVYEPERLHVDLEVEIEVRPREQVLVDEVATEIANKVKQKPVAVGYSRTRGKRTYGRHGTTIPWEDWDTGMLLPKTETIPEQTKSSDLTTYQAEKDELHNALVLAFEHKDTVAVEEARDDLYSHVQYGIRMGYETSHFDTDYLYTRDKELTA